MIKKAKLKKSIDGNENECILITYDVMSIVTKAFEPSAVPIKGNSTNTPLSVSVCV